MIPIKVGLQALKGDGRMVEIDLTEPTIVNIEADFKEELVQPIVINEELEILDGIERLQQLIYLKKQKATVYMKFVWKEKLKSLIKDMVDPTSGDVRLIHKGVTLGGGLNKNDLQKLGIANGD